MGIVAGEIHIWAIGLASAPRVSADASSLAVLDAAERRRATRFRSHLDRQRYVIARASLREILGTYLDVRPHEVRFALGAHGKPRADGIAFSLTHAGDLALVAVAADRDVGIDVEAVRPAFDAGLVAKRFFTARESASLAAAPAETRDAAFFACWTRKEAVVKALGLGLSVPLASFGVSLPGDGPARVVEATGAVAPADAWTLTHLAYRAGYVGALAARGAPPRVTLRQLAP